MNSSILQTVKKIIGLDGQTYFDTELIIFINNVLAGLGQIGLGDYYKGFTITGNTEKWSDLLDGYDDVNLNYVQVYVAYKVKMAFDPPQGSSATEAIKAVIDEAEWRINLCVDSHSIEEEI